MWCLYDILTFRANRFKSDNYTLTTDVNYFGMNDLSFRNLFMSIFIDLAIFSVLYSIYKIGKLLKPYTDSILSLIPKIQVQENEDVHEKSESTGKNCIKK
jgi:hypothetical protein